VKRAYSIINSFLLLATLSLLPAIASATHNRAGEIIYEHVSGFTYKITIITCTKASSYADRPYLKIYWGDEPSNVSESELDSLPRVVEEFLQGMDAKRNEYVGYHTYGGPGIFALVVEDPNRNSGVVNIVSSVFQVFCIRSVLVISPITGHNNSVQLLNPPKEQACFMQPWIHNPAAFDPDGDQLVYSLIPCMGIACEPLPGWSPPDVSTTDFTTDVFAIDSQTGDVTWNVPPLPGEFNIAILIEEFRDGIFVGSVVRDMQITVVLCSNNPPVIQPLPDYCIVAGDELEINVDWFDPDNDAVTSSAYGGPLTNVEHQATYNFLEGLFTWNPQCEEIRAQPYTVTFEATDNGYVNLTTIETVLITVVAPSVENPIATSQGNSILLNWDVHPCASIFTPITSQEVVYKIYRRNGLFGFEPGVCELGVPEYTGYTQIGAVTGLNSTSFTDTDVFYGGTYCYMVVTCFPDGAISFASLEFCAEIQKDVAVMTKVSIEVTDLTAGVDTVWWSPPTDLDTVVFAGPYQYKLYHNAALSGASNLVYESSSSDLLIWGDTTFIHSSINTIDSGHSYKVEFYSNSELVNTSSTASSVFLQAIPLDNAVQLQFNHLVPWTNYAYDVYRKGPDETAFSLVGNTIESTWIDESLTNNEVYCYYVISEGSYFAGQVPDPLFNTSQEACAQPFDQTPPCAPQLVIQSECSDLISELSWNNPNLSCADDVTAYNIYYAPVEGQELTLYATIDLAEDTSFVFNGDGLLNSIAGCFAITALDSLNLWPDGNLYQNESARSNIICVDNCPIYFLPNVFTPNGDGVNDLFVPFDFRYVQDIDLKIFNRWGILVFETKDPFIQWNGLSSVTGNLCADGAYYYTIQVNTIRLSGIVPENFSGTIQMLDAARPATSN